MDDGKGRFREVEEAELYQILERGKGTEIPYLFRVGEELTIKGSRFKVRNITPKKLILRLLPRLTDGARDA